MPEKHFSHICSVREQIKKVYKVARVALTPSCSTPKDNVFVHMSIAHMSAYITSFLVCKLLRGQEQCPQFCLACDTHSYFLAKRNLVA